MKTKNTAVKSKGNKIANAMTALGNVLTAPVALPAPVAPVVAAPVAPVVAAPIMGEADVTSKRVAKGVTLTNYRVVANQRKGVEAKYYVQGGTGSPHPMNPSRVMFAVAIEIPFTDLRAAQTRCVELNAALAKGVAKKAS